MTKLCSVRGRTSHTREAKADRFPAVGIEILSLTGNLVPYQLLENNMRPTGGSFDGAIISCFLTARKVRTKSFAYFGGPK